MIGHSLSTTSASPPDPVNLAGVDLQGASPSVVRLFHPEYGDLEDVVPAASFCAGVQVLRDRIAPDREYVLEATLTGRRAELRLLTVHGVVVGIVEPAAAAKSAVSADVRQACTAMADGSLVALAALFARSLELA